MQTHTHTQRGGAREVEQSKVCKERQTNTHDLDCQTEGCSSSKALPTSSPHYSALLANTSPWPRHSPAFPSLSPLWAASCSAMRWSFINFNSSLWLSVARTAAKGGRQEGWQATGSALKQHTHTLNTHTHTHAGCGKPKNNNKKMYRTTKEKHANLIVGPLVRPVSRPAPPTCTPTLPSPSPGNS